MPNKKKIHKHMAGYYNPFVRRSDAVVKGSGDAAKDQVHLVAATAQLNAGVGGTLWIDGNVILDGIYQFTKPVSIRGVHADSCIEVKSGQFNWGGYFNPLTAAGSGTIDPTGAFAEWFENPSIAISEGDWVVVWSDDAITGITPHESSNHPMEIHQVKELRSGTQYLLDDFIVDALTSTPRIIKIAPIKHAVVADLRLTYSGVAENTRLFDVRQCVNFTMENVLWDHLGPGPVVFNSCGDVNVHNCSCLGKHNYDTGFGLHIVSGVVNGMVMSDCDVRGVRHAFTTTAGAIVSTARWGTPRNVVVRNNRIGNNGKVGSSHIGLDTHVEGWGILFEGNYVSLPAEVTNIAGSARARRTIFRNNVVQGGGVAKGFLIAASGCVVESNFVSNVWYGVEIYNGGGDDPGETKITNNTFQDSVGPGVIAEVGDGHNISYNTFDNVGSVNYIDSKASIYCELVTGTRIIGNDLGKAANDRSIYGGTSIPGTGIKAIGNVCDGYGAGVMGFDPVPSTGASFESQFAGKNYTD